MIQFLEAQPGAENVEKLEQTAAQKQSKQVDFFLQHRTVLCELKSIQTSTESKVNALVEPILERPDAPKFYGEVRLDKIARQMPDGEQIIRDAYEEVVSSMQGFVRKANQQIRASKIAFNLPAAAGGLIMVNDQVKILSPEVMVSRVSELLRKRTAEGGFAFPEIEAVLVVNETHVVATGPGVKGPLMALVTRDAPGKAGEVLGALMPVWAQAHGQAYQEMDAELLATVPMKENAPAPSGPKRMTWQEGWERQYRNYPYLRWHTTDELKAYYWRVLESFAAGIMIGATAEEKAMLPQIVELQTHFLEEARERGLDFRTLGPAQPPALDETGRPRFRQATLAELQAALRKPPSFETGRFYTNAAGDYFRCIGVARESAQLIHLTIQQGRNIGLPKTLARRAWSTVWPIVDARLIGDLEKRYAAWRGKG
jgi:hypothetical protein